MGTWRKVIIKLHKSLVKNVQSYLRYSRQLITSIIFDLNAFSDLRYFDNEARSSIFMNDLCVRSIFYKALCYFNIVDRLIIDFML